MVLLAGARVLICPLHPNWFYQEKVENKIKNQISLKHFPHPPAASVRACWLKHHHPRRAPDTQGEGVLVHAMLTPAWNNMVFALCCITMDAQFPWKGFLFSWPLVLYRSPICKLPFAVHEVGFQSCDCLLSFCFWLSAIHCFLSQSHARFILYRRFFYILTVVEFKFALCFSLEYILLFPGLCSFLYNTQCQKFFIFAPHLVSDNLILGTVLTQQIPSTGSHFPDNIRSRALYLNLWAQFFLLHNALQQDIVWYKT